MHMRMRMLVHAHVHMCMCMHVHICACTVCLVWREPCMYVHGVPVVLVHTCTSAGKVTKGMDVVKKMEAVGSQSGSTAQPVKVAAAGEL